MDGTGFSMVSILTYQAPQFGILLKPKYYQNVRSKDIKSFRALRLSVNN